MVNEGGEIVLIHSLDLLDLVRCAEAVEEVDERYAALDGRKMCYTGEVHNFLYGAFGKHGEACLAAGHYVLVVTEY